MRLDLDGTAIIDPNAEVELKSAYDVIEEIETYLVDEASIDPLERPKKEAPDLSELVDRADDLTDNELGLYLMLFTQWASFFDYRLSVVTAAHKLAERNRKLMDAKIATELYADNVPKTEVAQRTRVHSMHLSFEFEEVKLYCMKQILQARYKAFSKQADTISRLITLREQEVDRQRRGSNIHRRGKGTNRPKLR